jgi:hypothetical protein
LNKTYSSSQKQNSAQSNHEEIETKNERGEYKKKKTERKIPNKETGRTCQSMTFDDKLGFENLPT